MNSKKKGVVVSSVRKNKIVKSKITLVKKKTTVSVVAPTEKKESIKRIKAEPRKIEERKFDNKIKKTNRPLISPIVVPLVIGEFKEKISKFVLKKELPKPVLERRVVLPFKAGLKDMGVIFKNGKEVSLKMVPLGVRKLFFNTQFLREAVAVLLMVGLLGGQFFGIFGMPTTVNAATYTTTWTTKSDFESNTAGNGGVFATTTNQLRTDTVTGNSNITADTLKMGPGAVVTFTDSFNDSSNLDGATTTAGVSAGSLVIPSEVNAVDLTSAVSGISTSEIKSMVYDSTAKVVYIGFLDGKFVRYNTSLYTGGGTYPTASTAYDLTSKISAIFGTSYVSAMAFDPINEVVYLGGARVADTNNARLTKYIVGSDSAVDLTSQITSFISSQVSSIVYDSVNQKMYFSGSWGCCAVPGFGRYNISGNTITDLSSKVSSSYGQGQIAYNAADQIIYITDNSTGFIKYDISANSSTKTALPNYAISMAYDPVNRAVYTGGTSDNGCCDSKAFYKYSLSTGLFGGDISVPAMNSYWPSNSAFRTIGRDSINNVFYIGPGNNGGGFAKYDGTTFTDIWSTISGFWGAGNAISAMAFDSNAGAMYIGGEAGKFAKKPIPCTNNCIAVSNVVSSGTNNIAYATLTKNDTLGGGTATYQLSNDNGVTWITVTPGVQVNFATSGHQLKYKIILTGGASVQDIRIDYNGYTTATLSNIKRDAGGDAVMTTLSWNVNMPANTQIVFHTRGATRAQTANALYSATWSDYTVSSSGVGSATIKTNGNGAIDPTYEYIEIAVDLISTDGLTTPYVSDFTLTHVINGAPDFDPTYGNAGASSSVSTTPDATWGKVNIGYSVRDTDTTTGTANPGFVTPSFRYSLDGGATWSSQDISSQYLGATDLNNKSVNQSTYTPYSAVWNAKAQLGTNTYSANAKIKVTVNDNEPVNNTAVSTSATFVLDTKAPVASGFHLDGSSASATLTLSASDDSNIKDYKISNNTDMSDDGNGLSATWQTVGATTLSLSRAWVISTSSPTTLVMRDVYGNTSTSTAVAPVAPSNLEFKDTSSPVNAVYSEFLIWGVYPAVASGATFTKYQLYRSSNGGASYSLLNEITDRTINYYSDYSVASTTTYYYKVRVVDTDGDISSYTAPVTDLPDGQGGTDTVPPTITSVAVSNIKNTSAKVTWTTDELANGEVNFGIDNSYGATASSSTYTLTHESSLTGLTPNTTYYFRVKSSDITGNTRTDNNNGSSYTFTTAGGPVISSVTVSNLTDTSATVNWNTSSTSNSYVDYSTSSNLGSYTEAGSATFVTGSGAPFHHSVVIAGLPSNATYYFQVKSTDGVGNVSVDTNNGTYYSFSTTVDTTPPTITAVQVPVTASNLAVITWQTNEPSSSQVEYGAVASSTTGNYGSVTQEISTPSVFHVASLSPETTKVGGGTNELSKNTTYYFRVKSKDPSNNQAISDEYSLTTNEIGTVVVSGGGGGQTIDRDPPTISVIEVSTTTAFGAVIKFNTNKEARGTIKYGTDITYDRNTSDIDFYTTHTIVLKDLHMGTIYHFKVNAIDRNGNVADSSDQTFKTLMLAEDLGSLKLIETSNSDDLQKQLENLIESALPSINPPYIDKPGVTDLTEDGATVSWKTNVKAYGSISYATDEEYIKGSTYSSSANEDINVKTANHKVELANLKPNTKYHFSVKSYVFPQAPATTEDAIFITKAASVQPQIVSKKKDSFHVVWNTDEKTTSVVEYRRVGATAYSKKADDTMTNIHDITIENLMPATNYELRVYGYTDSGNIVEAKENITAKTGVDVTPPKIESFKVDSALVPGRNDRTQTVVSWNTDEPATSVVHYEEGSGAPDKALANKQEDTNLSEKHVIILTNLRPGTIYRFQIESTDDSNNKTVLPIRTIITPKQSESIVDVIFKNFGDTFNFLNR